MTDRALLDSFPTDEREAFLLMTPSDDPENLVGEAFAAAVTFGDKGSIRELRLLLIRQVRKLALKKAVETLRMVADLDDDLGLCARSMLRAHDSEPLPKAAEDFVRSFALIVSKCLLDSKDQATPHRGRILTAVIDEARAIGKEKAA